VQTGHLRNSVGFDIKAPFRAAIGTNVEYGLYLELGTSKMAPRPFMRPIAADRRIATPGAESGNVITTAEQLKTIAGADLAVRGALRGYLAADANGDAVTGLTIASLANGTDGEVIATNAALTHFEAISEADGDLDIAVGCAGTGTCYLILITPGGKLVASSAITFA
jgi:hypothetical protein